MSAFSEFLERMGVCHVTSTDDGGLEYWRGAVCKSVAARNWIRNEAFSSVVVVVV